MSALVFVIGEPHLKRKLKDYKAVKQYYRTCLSINSIIYLKTTFKGCTIVIDRFIRPLTALNIISVDHCLGFMVKHNGV